MDYKQKYLKYKLKYLLLGGKDASGRAYAPCSANNTRNCSNKQKKEYEWDNKLAKEKQLAEEKEEKRLAEEKNNKQLIENERKRQLEEDKCKKAGYKDCLEQNLVKSMNDKNTCKVGTYKVKINRITKDAKDIEIVNYTTLDATFRNTTADTPMTNIKC